jgi:hypothetical protein
MAMGWLYTNRSRIIIEESAPSQKTSQWYIEETGNPTNVARQGIFEM